MDFKISFSSFSIKAPLAALLLFSVPAGPGAAAAAVPSQAGTQDAVRSERIEAGTGEDRFAPVELQPLKLEALISISRSLDPFRLDASGSRVVSLPDVLRIAVTQNLDIKIRQADVTSRDWALVSSYGSFLPNIQLGYRYQFLHGTLKVPFPGASGGDKINSPFIISSAGFTYNVYQGGRVLYTALQNKNYRQSSRFQERATISDTLFEATRRYLNLLLTEAVLQIRIKAVETSEQQLALNENLLAGGKATKLDVLQSRTQLLSDRQKLIDQQIARRDAAIELADLLNLDQGIDLSPEYRVVERRRLISETSTPAALLKTAVENRPELKQYKELWLAAQKTARINAARLQPNFQFFGTTYGMGETLGASGRTVTTSLGTAAATGTSGSSGSSVSQRHISRQIAPLYTLGYAANWSFNGLGVTDVGNIESARAQSRQAMLDLNKKLNSVTSEVRQSYLRTLSSYRKLDETMARVDSSQEELRMAQMRFQYGVGRNIDVLKAQEDCTSAMIENVQAMIAYNISQAQLLRDTGVISTDSLLSKAPLKLE
jgi:outer membrane protein